jgi:hypothetical protein
MWLCEIHVMATKLIFIMSNWKWDRKTLNARVIYTKNHCY